MPNLRLTESRIEALEARKSPYDVRDSGLKGFGVRVLPSGNKRFFVHSQHEGRRIWKTIGDAGGMRLEEARRRAVAFLAALRSDDMPAPREELLFEAVAREVFERYGRNWKPRTMEVNRGYLRNHILPWFGERNIADITRDDVQRWFASVRTTPVAADRSAPVLSVIMRRAELVSLQVPDLLEELHGDGSLLVRRSKTDCEGKGEVVWLGSDTLQLVRVWLDRAGIADGMLFRAVRKGGRIGERLNPCEVPRIFKAMARDAGLPETVAAGLSGHSARVGATQDMIAAGIELPSILHAGRWKSTAMVIAGTATVMRASCSPRPRVSAPGTRSSAW